LLQEDSEEDEVDEEGFNNEIWGLLIKF